MENRNTEFRGWNTRTKEMMSEKELEKQNYCLGSHGTIVGIDEDSFRKPPIKLWNCDWIIPLLSTGLKDRNGNTIYEGDIVLQKGYQPQEIWFDDGGYLIGTKNGSDEHFYQSFAENVEVTGNIFEQPELIK